MEGEPGRLVADIYHIPPDQCFLKAILDIVSSAEKEVVGVL